MGCGGSKPVALHSASSHHKRAHVNNTTTFITHNTGVFPSSSSSYNKKRSIPPFEEIPPLPDTDLFHVYANGVVDVKTDPVQNAKPRLQKEGIGRKDDANIRPTVELDSDFQIAIPQERAFTVVEFDGEHTEKRNKLETNSMPRPLKTQENNFQWSSSRERNIDLMMKVSARDSIEESLKIPDDSLDTSRTSSQVGTRANSAMTTRDSILTTSGLNTSFATNCDEDDDLNSELRLSMTPFMDSAIESYELGLRTPLSRSYNTPVGYDSGFRTPHSRSYITPEDYDPGFRTPGGITPHSRSSMDPTPATGLDRGFGTIIEEYEGGFTPRSARTDGSNINSLNHQAQTKAAPLKSFTHREVFQYNKRARMVKWVIYKGHVYETDRLKSTFIPLFKEAHKRLYSLGELSKNDPMDGDNDSGDISDSSDEMPDKYKNDYSEEDHRPFYSTLYDPQTWRYGALNFILEEEKDLNTSVVSEHLQSCCVGLVVNPTDSVFWEDIRLDVQALLEELNKESIEHSLSEYLIDYAQQLQRWYKKFKHQNPQKEKILSGQNPNAVEFPFPDLVTQSSLREWVQKWQPFDFEVPESGAWQCNRTDSDDDASEDKEFLSEENVHERFLSSLRQNDGCDFEDFTMDVDGEAAWAVIPLNIFADDVMTNEQMETERQRSHRTDLHDPSRMKRRRQSLLTYFVRKYELDLSSVSHFLTWADEMERSQREFLRLCET